MTDKAIFLEKLLSENHFENIYRENAASVFVKEPEYQLLTLKMAALQSQGLEDSPYSYIFESGRVHELRPDGEIAVFKDGFEGFMPVLEARIDRVGEILSGYVDEIEELEDRFYERKPPRYFMDLWFNLKKDVSKIERNFSRAALVLREFLKGAEIEESWVKSELIDLVETIDARSRSCSTQLAKLDNLRHYFDSLKTDKLNNNIYFLTLVSGVFLPMNLIVGFFGINTPNLFFHDDPNGTLNVVYIVAGVFLVFMFGLPILRVIDQIILRKILGRYNFYRRVSDKIENLSDSINMN